MKLAIFGGTGKNGRALVDLALTQGHTVRALARTPLALVQRAGLTVAEGSASVKSAVAETVSGCDAAISLLGSFDRKPNTEISNATRTICAVLSEHGPRRLSVVTTIGTGDSFVHLRSIPFKLFIRLVAKETWRDRECQETVVRQSALKWTVIRPGGLTDRAATGRWTLIGSGEPQPKRVSIARADLAAALLPMVTDTAIVGQTRRIFTDAT